MGVKDNYLMEVTFLSEVALRPRLQVLKQKEPLINPWSIRVRKCYGAYFFLAGSFKLVTGLLWSRSLERMFTERLMQLEPQSFAADYLSEFAIPMAYPIAYILTIGELLVGISFYRNLVIHWGALLAIFITLNIAIGGFFNPIILPFIFYPITVLMTRFSSTKIDKEISQ